MGSKIKAIGRLDMTTEGLILLTNDGLFKRELELPCNQLHRVYRVRVHGNLTDKKLRALRSGVLYRGIKYKGMKVEIERERKEGVNIWLKMTCVEGKNRLIRNVCECLGLQVTRLIRIGFGDYTLKSVPIAG